MIIFDSIFWNNDRFPTIFFPIFWHFIDAELRWKRDDFSTRDLCLNLDFHSFFDNIYWFFASVSMIIFSTLLWWWYLIDSDLDSNFRLSIVYGLLKIDRSSYLWSMLVFPSSKISKLMISTFLTFDRCWFFHIQLIFIFLHPFDDDCSLLRVDTDFQILVRFKFSDTWSMLTFSKVDFFERDFLIIQSVLILQYLIWTYISTLVWF